MQYHNITHHVATQLNKLAETTPVVFDWVLIPEIFTGAELNLSPLAETQTFEPTAMYTVNMPAMLAVNHKQQIKDAYKRGGFPAVKEYHQSVMAKIKNKNDN